MQDDRDEAIVLRAQQGDRDAFGELVSRYQGLVASIALSGTGDLQRSEDVAQQAFVIAWQKIGELSEPTKFAAWLVAITRNTVRNANRKAEGFDRAAAPLHTHDVADPAGGPDEASSRSEQQELLWQCLRSVSEPYREPLVLYYRQGKSMQEVASQLDLTVDAVKKRLSRGRAMIKEDARPFVERILGATAPGARFSGAVMAALAVTAGSASAQRSAMGAARHVVANAASAATRWNLWVSLYCLIYGMGATEKNVGATIVKNQFHWFARGASFVTALVATLAVSLYFLGGESMQRGILIGSAIYAVVLVVTTVYFAFRQRRLDQLHGRKKARFEEFEIHPATPREFRKAISGVALGSWAWVALSAYTAADYVTLACALAIATVVNVLRRRQSVRATTVPAQMKFQAVNFALHASLSTLLFWLVGLLGRPAHVLGFANWQVGILVLALAAVSIHSAWRAANKFENRMRDEAAGA